MSDNEYKYKYVNLYCAERRDNSNKSCGNMLKRIDYKTDDEFNRLKNELRDMQKLKNAEWRRNHPKSKKQYPATITPKINSLKYNEMPIAIKPSSSNQFNAAVNKLFEASNKLPPFDFDGLETKFESGKGTSIVILGSSKAGKTFVMREIYNKYYAHTQTIFSAKFISVLFSINMHSAVYDQFETKKINGIDSIIKCNKFDKNSQRLINQCKKLNMDSKNKFNFTFVLDDIIDSKYSSVLNNLILTYRNSSISSIIALQYPYLLSKASRSSINQLIFGHFNTDESIRSVIESFLGSIFTKMGVITMPAQIALYKKLTENYHFLYYYSRKDILLRFKLQI